MVKKIKDLTAEELAGFYKLDCPKCLLNKIECVDICVDAWEFIKCLKDVNEEVEL